ncbi:hypothetical protein MKX03_015848 [Papaver bracteatum]|nr:hypothetical protein MKX03_015848 [Papaver bracteatum]
MGTMETEEQLPEKVESENVKEEINEEEESPIEEVRLTVTNTDDHTLPVWTFRTWFLGLLSCGLLSFLNQFFAYRTEPLVITQITVQVAVLPIGHFMAKFLPKTKFHLPIRGIASKKFSLNPGPFNMKEHVLISIFANAGSAFGSAFYGRDISFLAGWLLIITTQVLGYGWAGLLRKYVLIFGGRVPSFKALHEKDTNRMSRAKFFLIAFVCSFAWYVAPVTAKQIGSGMRGLGVGAFSLDWSAVASFLFIPLISPFFAIVNVFFGYVLFMYVAIQIAYWGFDLYHAKTFPIFTADLFRSNGESYNITATVNSKFEIDYCQILNRIVCSFSFIVNYYDAQGRINLSTLFALSYGFGFATIAFTLTHVGVFYGREIYERFRASYKGKEDIHTRLMNKYPKIPDWWFYVMLDVTIVVSLILCIVLNDQVQLPYWGLIFACGLAFILTLPISIITATKNQICASVHTPGLNIITECIMGLILPGYPIANSQAVSFLSDFKLGHYMKIPPRSMFLVQLIGTIIAGTVNIGVAWWLLTTTKDICHPERIAANSPWTCPSDRVFFDASVIWGLVGPKRIFGPLGNYPSLNWFFLGGAVGQILQFNWFFLGGAVGQILVWLPHKAFPNQSRIALIHLPVLLGAIAYMPPARAVNYNSWIIVGMIFNYFVFRDRKKWWTRYNYVLSAAHDAGAAFMGVLLYSALTLENQSLNLLGTSGEHFPLVDCPTAPGVIGDPQCPVF